VKKGEAPNEYIVKGNAKWIGPGVFTRSQSGSFDLYLIRGLEIVDHVPFLLRGGLVEDQNVLIEFKTEETFDKMLIEYRIRVSE
jgi:hypothetical protein